MTFANPGYFLLLLPLAAYVIWYLLRNDRSEPSMQVSTTSMYDKLPKSPLTWLRHLPFLLRVAGLVLLIIVLARPQSTHSWQRSEVEGIDIMMAVDISTSMLAEDLKPNRLEAAKQVAADFINGRPNDNIGLTIFAGQSFTQSPLTTDHAVLLNIFNNVSCDMVQNGTIMDGTAIGDGIANAVTRLKDSQAKSKVIILLTDGSNNRGEISPLTAAEIAKTFGIRVYTIGVGTNGTAPYPIQAYGRTIYQNIPVEIDENTLQQIAQTADGQYYRATSNSKLKEVYEEIDKLEKTKLNVKDFSRKNEEFMPFALAAMLCILLELLLRLTLLRRIP
jgi:Ca-activated chloride channel family protein